MATTISKYKYLDNDALLQLSKDIFTNVNTRIAERIVDTIVDDSYTATNKSLSAKAVLALIGKSSDTESAEGTLFARIAAVKAAAETTADALEDVDERLEAVEEALGEAGDEKSAIGSAFARIAQNKDDITGLKTEIGTAEDVAGTQTIYGKIADVAAAAGSASELQDIKTKVSQAEKDIDALEAAVGTAEGVTAKADGTVYERIKKNADDIAGNTASIGTNTAAISEINELLGEDTEEGTVMSRLAAVEDLAEAAATQTALNGVSTRVGTLESNVGTKDSKEGTIYERLAAVETKADAAATDDDLSELESTVEGHTDSISSINSNLGVATSDASGTGSIYERISAVRTVANAAATKTELKATDDKAEANKTDIGTLKNSVGASTDPASADGSLYARIKALDGKITSLDHLKYQIVEGEITTVVKTPQSDVLYLQRDDEDDETWNLYVYATEEGTSTPTWVCVGDTDIDIDNYWSKEDDDVEELRDMMFEALTTSEITQIVTNAFNATTPTL